ncbi:MAG: hypothetical protein APR62_03500 [Smithella sp. SDB]|nr:MAG: hypothetical protein APR62_03500 [Smithella sp. SDB]
MRTVLKARIPVQQRGIETKEKIISAAMVLFAEKGYHKTNAMEIAAKADIATGTFYSYFNNKKEVFSEIIIRVFKNIAESVLLKIELKTHNNHAENYKELRNIIHFIVNNILQAYRINNRLFKEILAMVLLDHEIEKIRIKEEKKVINLLVVLFQTYKDSMRISDLEAAAVLLLKFMEEMVHIIKFGSTDIKEKRLLKEIEDLMCRYLLIDSLKS